MATAHPLVNEIRQNKIICVRCEEWKDPGEFGSSPRMQRKVHSWCRECMRQYNRGKNAAMTEEQRQARRVHRRTYGPARAREWRAKNPDKSSAATRKYRYGLTSGQFAQMLERQGGLCAIPTCNRAARHVDHDHSCCPGVRSCGKCVRGILCGGCNRMLRMAAEDPRRLRAAASWLEQQRLKDVHTV